MISGVSGLASDPQLFTLRSFSIPAVCRILLFIVPSSDSIVTGPDPGFTGVTVLLSFERGS
jgi:hypothetical protein